MKLRRKIIALFLVALCFFQGCNANEIQVVSVEVDPHMGQFFIREDICFFGFFCLYLPSEPQVRVDHKEYHSTQVWSQGITGYVDSLYSANEDKSVEVYIDIYSYAPPHDDIRRPDFEPIMGYFFEDELSATTVEYMMESEGFEYTGAHYEGIGAINGNFFGVSEGKYTKTKSGRNAISWGTQHRYLTAGFTVLIMYDDTEAAKAEKDRIFRSITMYTGEDITY